MPSTSKKITILGSTGSIGRNSLEVIENLRRNGTDLGIAYLSTNTNIRELSLQIKKFTPKGVIILDENKYNEFKSTHNFKNLEILCGKEGLNEVAKRDDYNFLINAVVGFSGLEPTIEAIKTGKDIAIANKETLVVAGEIIIPLIKKYKNKLLPIDSEHSAILQCLKGEEEKNISKIILTASGGPFLNRTISEMEEATVEQALSHPNWKMGNKITIDSATMMNKGLEVIEAKWLFNVNSDQIEVVIHPQSIIHSFVEFVDGSVKAQLGIPDMKIPIQYSLTYPERVQSDYPKLDFLKHSTLTFEKPDLDKFKCLKTAYDTMIKGGFYPTVMNAANEIAVELFLNRKIKFKEISEIIDQQLEEYKSSDELTLDNIIGTDTLVRKKLNDKYF